MISDQPHSGFISLAGAPNVGKSTLMNRFLGADLAIVSPKPQTTWNVIRGIVNDPRGQIIFIDTPGLHQPVDNLGNHMVASSRRALTESDLVFWLVDCRQPVSSGLAMISRYLGQQVPAFLVINKVDLIEKTRLLPLIKKYSELDIFVDIFPISALSGDNVDNLLSASFKYLPPGAELFPPEQLSDQPEKEIIREFIREKVFLNTRQEIPYASAVKIEYIEKDNDRLLIGAVIYVERNSQKGILVGKGGTTIKRIGMQARRRIEALVGIPVYLDLRVKLRKKWRGDERSLKEFGYRR